MLGALYILPGEKKIILDIPSCDCDNFINLHFFGTVNPYKAVSRICDSIDLSSHGTKL